MTFRLALYAAILVVLVLIALACAIVAAFPPILYPVAVICYVVDKIRRVRSGEPWLTGS